MTSSTSQAAASSGPIRSMTVVAHRLLGRAGQDPAVDLDRRLARDHVVLHAGVDDVRADRVAEERPDDARRHRLAERVEGGLGEPRVVAGERTQDAGRLAVEVVGGAVEERRHRRR